MARLLLLAFAAMAVLRVSRATDPIENRESEVTNFHGDILLTQEQRAAIESMSNPNDPQAPMQAVVRSENALWPNGIVYYELDGSLNNLARNAIQAAMNDYTTFTCIRFQQRTNQADYVRFFRGSGCYSYIGRIGGGQEISIGQNCEYKGIVIHEIFHALGRWHEQSRPDRDQYVEILTNNIIPGFEDNFDQVESRFVTTQGVPYDYRSVMHYGAYAFSSNGQPTIRPVQPGVSVQSIGQREGFSNDDIQHVLALYCSDAPSSWSSWSAWTSCSQTCNGGTRSRTRTCNGGGTCEGANIDTETCNTVNCPIAPAWGSWTTWSGCSASCGGGRQTRQRQCVGGNTCTGTQQEFRDCNTNSCPEPPVWTSWGSWSSCSATCAGGMRTRNRRCVNGNTCPGSSSDTEPCNENIDCNPKPDLIGEIYIGCNLVPSSSATIRLLEGTTPDLSDDPLTRTNSVEKCGLAAIQQGYEYFGVSIGYCISGSNNLEDYNSTSTFYPGYCSDGVGGVVYYWRYTYFFMDVYKVTDASSFTTSADSAIAGAVTTAPPTSTVGEDESSGVTVHKHSLLLLSITLAIVLATLLH